MLLSTSQKKIDLDVCVDREKTQWHWETAKEFLTIALPVNVGEVCSNSYIKERPQVPSGLHYFINTWLAQISPEVWSSFTSHMQFVMEDMVQTEGEEDDSVRMQCATLRAYGARLLSTHGHYMYVACIGK